MLWRGSREAELRWDVTLPGPIPDGFAVLVARAQFVPDALVWHRLLSTESPATPVRFVLSDASLVAAFPNPELVLDLSDLLGEAPVGSAFVAGGVARVLVLGQLTEAGLEALLAAER